MIHGFHLFSLCDCSWLGNKKCNGPGAKVEKRWVRTAEEEGSLKKPEKPGTLSAAYGQQK